MRMHLTTAALAVALALTNQGSIVARAAQGNGMEKNANGRYASVNGIKMYYRGGRSSPSNCRATGALPISTGR